MSKKGQQGKQPLRYTVYNPTTKEYYQLLHFPTTKCEKLAGRFDSRLQARAIKWEMGEGWHLYMDGRLIE